MARGAKDLKSVVALCKRRGFVYPGSDLYGGFANTYSFGPYGAQMKKNIKDLWWEFFVERRDDVVGLDGPILLHPKVWHASGHVEGFSDALVDCKGCKTRHRADHLIEEVLHESAEGLSLVEMGRRIQERRIPCPVCGVAQFTEARQFNLMFETEMGKTGGSGERAYLRPETAQAIFIDFKNIVDTMRVKLPFGVAQMGKAFRNEITPGNFLFRVIEFEQMEIEYFLREEEWGPSFGKWLNAMKEWCSLLGLQSEHVYTKEHTKEQLSHYSKRTVDLVYDFPFGRQELYGLAYRTNFDLSQHAAASKVSLSYTDPDTKEKSVPHVIEPTFGVERTFLALLCDALEEEELPNGETRTVLHLVPRVAPVKCALFPLMKQGPLVQKARALFETLRPLGKVEYDESGAIGKRYRRQDELGTPYCVTVDFETLDHGTVTLRDRDTMGQIRLHSDELLLHLREKLYRT